MIQISYENTVQHRYMIISQKVEAMEQSFRIQMLMQNKISHLLSLHIQYEDERRLLYYDVTGMQSLEEFIASEYLSYVQLKHIFIQIIDAVRASNEYMLVTEFFLLQPQYIFIEKETKNIYLCYYEGKKQELITQLHELSSVLLNHIDYKDQQAVFMGYQFYQLTNQQHITLEEIEEGLQGERVQRETKLEVVPSEENDSGDTGANGEEKLKKEIIDEKKEKSRSGDSSEGENQSGVTIVYTIITIFLCIGVFVLAKYTGILNHAYGKQLDIKKVMAMVLVVGLIEGVFLVKIFEKKSHLEECALDVTNSCVPICHSSESQLTRIEEEPVYMQTTVLNESYYMLQPCDIPGEPIVITKFPFIIGSLPEKVDGIVHDRAVSRVHAKFEQDKKRIFIEDLQSTNGTYLNEQVMMQQQKYPLQPGDTLQLGNHKYRFLKQVG